LPQISEGYVTKLAPQLTLKLIASVKLTFDEWVVLHRVGILFRISKSMIVQIWEDVFDILLIFVY